MNHMMNSAIYIATCLGSSLIIVLIFINYIGKFNVDDFQQKLLLTLLCAAFVAVITDFIRYYFDGNPGAGIRGLLYAGNTLFLIAQNCTYYLSAIFIDYFAHKDTQRSKKFMIGVIIFLALYSVSVIVNLPLGYYFTILPGGHFEPGRLYLLRFILSYASILVIILNMLLSFKYLKHSQVYSVILFFLIPSIGSVIDIIFSEGNLVWPCFTAAILYMYFFIIQSDLKIDSLTRIGNRASFNEFIDKLSRQSSRQEYTIVMIDMDRFKEINDTLGHLEGDNALRDIATIIKSCIRHSDFAARYGGDEFVLAIGAEYDIQRVMHRIQETVNQQNERRLRPYQLYISYGYDIYSTRSSESISDFLAKIDAKMYQQKDERKRKGIPSAITSQLPDKDAEEINV